MTGCGKASQRGGREREGSGPDAVLGRSPNLRQTKGQPRLQGSGHSHPQCADCFRRPHKHIRCVPQSRLRSPPGYPPQGPARPGSTWHRPACQSAQRPGRSKSRPRRKTVPLLHRGFDSPVFQISDRATYESFLCFIEDRPCPRRHPESLREPVPLGPLGTQRPGLRGQGPGAPPPTRSSTGSPWILGGRATPAPRSGALARTISHPGSSPLESAGPCW